jgi:L-iditol 2-dehydrogenase
MKALLLTDYRRLELADLPQPEVGPDDVLVRVAACGICGSDVHGFDGSTGRRIPPLVMGHEAAGVVEAVGRDVTRFKPGERVTFDSTVWCGECAYCRSGRNNLCDRREVLGVSCGDYRRHGAFAEYVVVPGRIAYSLPDAVPMEHAALIEPVSVAAHAVQITLLEPKPQVAVIGSGMIGLLVIQILRRFASSIIAVDIDDDRLALAQKLGAHVAINAAACDAAARILELTGGRGLTTAIEVVGTTDAIATAIRSVSKGGAVTLVGNVSPTVEIPLQMVVGREIKLFGSCASSGDYLQSIKLLETGAVDVRPLISACVPLAEGPQWFQRLYNREPNLMKVILQP